jgi:putative membrane protein
MLIVGIVCAGLSAIVHVYIFWLESIVWAGPRSRRIFGLRSDAEVEHTRALASNQGFYNLFLAVVASFGIVLLLAGAQPAGAALVLASTGSMLAAALVLALSARRKRRAALVQGFFPLLAVVGTVTGLLLQR